MGCGGVGLRGHVAVTIVPSALWVLLLRLHGAWQLGKPPTLTLRRPYRLSQHIFLAPAPPTRGPLPTLSLPARPRPRPPGRDFVSLPRERQMQLLASAPSMCFSRAEPRHKQVRR